MVIAASLGSPAGPWLTKTATLEFCISHSQLHQCHPPSVLSLACFYVRSLGDDSCNHSSFLNPGNFVGFLNHMSILPAGGNASVWRKQLCSNCLILQQMSHCGSTDIACIWYLHSGRSKKESQFLRFHHSSHRAGWQREPCCRLHRVLGEGEREKNLSVSYSIHRISSFYQKQEQESATTETSQNTKQIRESFLSHWHCSRYSMKNRKELDGPGPSMSLPLKANSSWHHADCKYIAVSSTPPISLWVWIYSYICFRDPQKFRCPRSWRLYNRDPKSNPDSLIFKAVILINSTL